MQPQRFKKNFASPTPRRWQRRADGRHILHYLTPILVFCNTKRKGQPVFTGDQIYKIYPNVRLQNVPRMHWFIDLLLSLPHNSANQIISLTGQSLRISVGQTYMILIIHTPSLPCPCSNTIIYKLSQMSRHPAVIRTLPENCLHLTTLPPPTRGSISPSDFIAILTSQTDKKIRFSSDKIFTTEFVHFYRQ